MGDQVDAVVNADSKYDGPDHDASHIEANPGESHCAKC
jgi:hypothetical protein